MDFEIKRNLKLEEAIKMAGLHYEHSLTEDGQGEYFVRIGYKTYYVMAGAVPEYIWKVLL